MDPPHKVTFKLGIGAETFAALKHYNYRLWFLGQMVSLMGTWMQADGQGYSFISSPIANLSGPGRFYGGSADLVVLPFRGVVADRTPAEG